MPTPKPKRRAVGTRGYFNRTDNGRPTLYNVRFVEIARGMAENGALSTEIARRFGISVKTLWDWSNAHEDFGKALEPGIEAGSRRTRRSLFERANGYTFESEVIKVVNGEVVRVPILEHVPPDVNAALTWLQKHLPEEWGKVGTNKMEHSGSIGLSMADLICEVHRQREEERAAKAILIEGPKDDDKG